MDNFIYFYTLPNSEFYNVLTDLDKTDLETLANLVMTDNKLFHKLAKNMTKSEIFTRFVDVLERFGICREDAKLFFVRELVIGNETFGDFVRFKGFDKSYISKFVEQNSKISEILKLSICATAGFENLYFKSSDIETVENIYNEIVIDINKQLSKIERKLINKHSAIGFQFDRNWIVRTVCLKNSEDYIDKYSKIFEYFVKNFRINRKHIRANRKMYIKSFNKKENIDNVIYQNILQLMCSNNFELANILIDGQGLRNYVRNRYKYLQKKSNCNFEYFFKLKVIELYYSDLKYLPECLQDFKNVETLHLGYNKIESLPIWLENLPNLKQIYFNDNPPNAKIPKFKNIEVIF